MAENTQQSTQEHHEHVTPVSVYLTTYVILMLLLGATVLAYYVRLPYHWASNVVALLIAVIKAALVVLFFMGVKYSSKLTLIWAGAGLAWLLIMFMIIGDYITRHWVPTAGW